MKNQPSKTGQSLGEYALAAALVAIVGIGACTFVATQAGNALPDLTARIFNGGGGPMQVTSPTGSKGTLPTPTDDAPLRIVGNQLSFTSTTGETFTFPVDASIPDIVETAGGNGVLELYLAQLDQEIYELEQSGEASTEELAVLKALKDEMKQHLSIMNALKSDSAKYFIPGKGIDYLKMPNSTLITVDGLTRSRGEWSSDLVFSYYEVGYSSPGYAELAQESTQFDKLLTQIKTSSLPANRIDKIVKLAGQSAQYTAMLSQNYLGVDVNAGTKTDYESYVNSRISFLLDQYQLAKTDCGLCETIPLKGPVFKP